MSTKLYEGFRLKGVSTIEDALSFIEDIKEPVKERILVNLAKEIKTLACLMYDLYGLGEDMFEESEDHRNPLLSATMRILKEGDQDQEFSIGLTSVDGQVLGHPFFPESGYSDIVLDHLDVDKFGYWDNTDPDENATEEEWAERERLWDKVFEKDSIFNRAMFIIVLADKSHMVPTDEHMVELPTVEEREKAVATQLAWAEASLDYDPQTSKLYDLMVKVKELTPNHQKQIKGKLKDITIKTLEQPLPPIKENNKDGSERISDTGS